MRLPKKRDGFIGEEAIVLPKMVIQQCEHTPLVNTLFITDIGYYPKARYHYRERRSGIDQHIFIYCIDGKGELMVEGKKFPISSSNFLIIPKGKKHYYRSDSNQPWTIYWIHVKGSNADVLSEILFRKMLAGKNILLPTEELISVFHKIYENLKMGYSTDNMIYASLNLANFLSIFIFFENESKKIELKDDFSKVIQFLHENINRTLKLNEISEVMNISPSHFSNKFKETTGYSPIEYFNHIKLQKACHLLRFTQMRINEIALEIGIMDSYYFSRLFSQHMGVSPKEFRKRKLITV